MLIINWVFIHLLTQLVNFFVTLFFAHYLVVSQKRYCLQLLQENWKIFLTEMLLMDLISHISSEVLNSSAFGTNLNIYDEAFREKS